MSSVTVKIPAQLRAATGGEEVDTPAGVWVHDLRTTSRYTDVWPWLLVLALLLGFRVWKSRQRASATGQ